MRHWIAKDRMMIRALEGMRHLAGHEARSPAADVCRHRGVQLGIDIR